jgi:acyl-CoA synthetase (AMP-forming)/AMP-acid ligase II
MHPKLLEADLSSLRAVGYAAAHLPREFLNRLSSCLSNDVDISEGLLLNIIHSLVSLLTALITLGYGLSECVSDSPKRKMNSSN